MRMSAPVSPKRKSLHSSAGGLGAADNQVIVGPTEQRVGAVVALDGVIAVVA
jgi:hypothetical protein